MIMIIYIMMIIMLIILTLSLLNNLISKKKMMNREKSSPFECGFDPLSSPRTPFSLRFYLISVIFLIFDIEIIILFPLISSLWFSNPYKWMFTSLLFSILLIMGLFIEWKEGALFWMK
uniref:NADH-ubiquinone oxidoreductase chain 3 n=1 Tax=Janus sp. 1 GYN-2022e TaxID=3003421 RepID=A0A9E8YYU9_9HYME|nr:NADH dehydrogenase subunit 3 [Janus sp. 1 GYN-2022e]